MTYDIDTKYAIGAVIGLVVLSTVPLAVAGAHHEMYTYTVSGHPDLHAKAPDNEFVAGSDATLKLYLQNTGVVSDEGPHKFESEVQKAQTSTLSISAPNSPIEVHTGEYPAGTMPVGRNGPYSIHITVPEGTKPGTYDLKVEASYTYTSSVHYTDGSNPDYNQFHRTETMTVPVVVKDQAAFAVEGHSTDTQVGQRGTYSVTVNNTGTEPANNAVVTVQSQSKAITFGAAGASASDSVGRWDPGETKTFTYDAAVADTTGVHNYSVPVSIKFDDENGISHEAKRLVTSFRPQPEQTFAIRDLRSTLRTGRADGTVSGTVVNTGSQPVHAGTLVLQSNASFDTRAISLGRLGPGESQSFSFTGGTIPNSMAIDSLPLSLAVRYDNAAGDRYTSDAYDIQPAVRSNQQKFSITAVNTIPAGTRGTPPAKSDWSQLKLRVTNQGNTTLHNVKPQLVFQTPYAQRPVESNHRTTVIGTLAPGESKIATFSVSASESSGGTTYPLTTMVTYDQADGVTRKTSPYTVPVNIASDSHKRLAIKAMNAIPAGTRGDTPKDSDWSELTLRVTNRGNTTLHNVKPRLVFTSQYYERPIESNHRTGVIDTLQPGESKNVTYSVSASKAAGGTTYPLSVKVAYDQPNGVTRSTNEYTVPVTIAERSSLPLLPLGGGAVIIIGFAMGGVIWWRRSPS